MTGELPWIDGARGPRTRRFDQETRARRAKGPPHSAPESCEMCLPFPCPLRRSREGHEPIDVSYALSRKMVLHRSHRVDRGFRGDLKFPTQWRPGDSMRSGSGKCLRLVRAALHFHSTDLIRHLRRCVETAGDLISAAEGGSKSGATAEGETS